MKRRTLNGIDEDDFIHPRDEEAMKVLRAVPGFEHMVKQLMQHGFEKILALQLTGMAVKAGPRQFAPLYERFVRDCEILDMPVPDLYIVNSPIPNAWTYGETQPLVGITSGLVALMDEDEVDFVIGHELGHIKCHHVLYRVVAENMKKQGGYIPGIRPGTKTAEYIDHVLTRITFGGAIYVAAVCVVPMFVQDAFKVSFYFGGTSLLIIVSVALDTVQQIESHLITRHYDGFTGPKGPRIRGRRAKA